MRREPAIGGRCEATIMALIRLFIFEDLATPVALPCFGMAIDRDGYRQEGVEMCSGMECFESARAALREVRIGEYPNSLLRCPAWVGEQNFSFWNDDQCSLVE